MMTLEQIAEIEAGCEGVPAGPWEVDVEEQSDAPGRYNEYALFNAVGHRMCGTENSDSLFGLIETESPDEDGFYSSWNEPSRKLMEHLKKFDPDTVRELCRLARLGLEMEQGNEDQA